MSLLRQGKAEVLTIYIGESDQWQGETLYTAIVHFLRIHGCAGATVTRAVAGYGAGARLHKEHVWRLSSDAPMIVQAVDQPERLRRLLPELQEMVQGGLMTLHPTDVLKYTHARRKGLPTKLPVRQVMETSLTAVTQETSVASVIDILLEASFRSLPVVDAQQRLVGMIGTRDLITAGLLPVRRGILHTARDLENGTAEPLEKSLAQARQSPQHAAEIMNRNIRSITPEQAVREAARIMVETGLRSLPVVEADGRLVGIVTRADLLQVVMTSPLMSQEASSLTQPLRRTSPLTGTPVQQQPVRAYMTLDVATAEEQTPLSEVIDALITSPVKRVIVLNRERQVQGIISDVDVLARTQAEGRSGWLRVLTGWSRGKPGHVPTSTLQTPAGTARTAADLMNREVVTISEDASVQETIEKMLLTGRKVLPVVDGQERLQGTVGRSDVLRILLEG
jgi:CBS domain-containing protein